MTTLPSRAQRAKSSASSSLSGAAAASGSDRFRPLVALGFKGASGIPTPETPVVDLLLYALTYRSGPRPDLDMVLVVAAELEALSMFVEGPLHVTLSTASRRLRVAVDLAERLVVATGREIG
jgi:hypothetical protein